jgi:hypothetical protein
METRDGQHIKLGGKNITIRHKHVQPCTIYKKVWRYRLCTRRSKIQADLEEIQKLQKQRRCG